MNTTSRSKTPILYSFRRCPYAIRARMAIHYSGVVVELREIVLRDKPTSMLEYSPKGTVPVLILPDGRVIDESRDVMDWALSISDPASWGTEIKQDLIEENDLVFKKFLDQYKYADRFPEHPAEYYRDQCEAFLQRLENALIKTKFLISDQITKVDIAIFPFIRQFVFVDKTWFDQTRYEALKKWMDYFLSSDLFLNIMEKNKAWKQEDKPIYFNK